MEEKVIANNSTKPTATSVFLSTISDSSSNESDDLPSAVSAHPSVGLSDVRGNVQLHEERMSLLDEIEADLSVTESLASSVMSDDEEMPGTYFFLKLKEIHQLLYVL